MSGRDTLLIGPSTSKNYLRAGRISLAFLLAGLVTGTNWYIQTRLAFAQRARQHEIQKRVNSNTTVNINQLHNLAELDNIEGAKVQVTGELQTGRFIVKRNKGDQEGYIVLAPFIVDKKPAVFNRFDRTQHTKFMLNLGWVPKDSKHRIKDTAAINILKFDELPEELANDEDAPARSTITAYVRKGESRDIFRGYNNFTNDRLYKFIDLPLMERVFSAIHPSFRHVYLDRVGQNDESFPFPNSTQQYNEQIKQQISHINKRSTQLTVGVGLASFISAAIFAAI